MSLPTASNISEIQEAIRTLPTVRTIGSGTKPALSRDATLSVRPLKGVLQYEPSEYTFTALAGTPLADLVSMLNEHGQFLPFDPPWVESGATLGGTVASGTAGPGRFRYGGVRDFLLGVRLVTGEGRIVFGGGKVVKNAAGFDIPKLMVGSLGRFGVLAELTFKVFPRPEAYATLKVDCGDLAAAKDNLLKLSMSPLELACLDLEPPNRLWLRVGGLAEALPQRADRVGQLLDAEVEILDGEADRDIWSAAREFAWVPSDSRLLKIPHSPNQLSETESALDDLGFDTTRRYSVGCHVLWLAWPKSQPLSRLEQLLGKLGRPAMCLTGDIPVAWIGRLPGQVMSDRLLDVFDPERKLGGVHGYQIGKPLIGADER